MSLFEQGNSYYLTSNYQKAKDCYVQALQTEPDSLLIKYNLGLTCYALGENELALRYINDPANNNFAEGLISRGAINRALGRYYESLRDFGLSIAYNPESSKSHYNYGNVLREFGRPELGLHFCRVGQVLEPNNSTAHMNEAISLLLAGELVAGWEKYEWRWNYEEQDGKKPQLNGPEWNGESLQNKTILVYSEQGLGDSLQFVRYLPMLERLGAKIIFITRPQLSKLFKANYNYDIREFGTEIEEFDYHCALMSLPRVFKTTMNTIPNELSYISINEADKQQWKARLGPKIKPRIGIVWKTNVISGTNRFKSMDLKDLINVVSDRYQFISLAIDIEDADGTLLKQYGVESYAHCISDFHDTAGLVANLDLVITIDTAMAHLAGAMGVRTWVMLPKYGVDWRWFLNRSDSPWYPNSTLIRQADINDWSSVVSNIKSRLQSVDF